MSNYSNPTEVVILSDKARLPEYGTPNSAGADLFVMVLDENGDPSEITVNAGETYLFRTGLKIFIKNPSFAGFIYPRSGKGHKMGVVLGNGTGVIDADYKGELMISIFNRSKETFTIKHGEAVAQYVLQPVARFEFNIVEEFSEETARGEGGFGHTGN